MPENKIMGTKIKGTKLEATLGSLNMLPVNKPIAFPIKD